MDKCDFKLASEYDIVCVTHNRMDRECLRVTIQALELEIEELRKQAKSDIYVMGEISKARDATFLQLDDLKKQYGELRRGNETVLQEARKMELQIGAMREWVGKECDISSAALVRDAQSGGDGRVEGARLRAFQEMAQKIDAGDFTEESPIRQCERCAELLLKGVRFATPADETKAIQNVALGIRGLIEQESTRDAVQATLDFIAYLKKMRGDCFVPTMSKEALSRHMELIGGGVKKAADTVVEKWPPLDNGTVVKTTRKMTPDSEWTKEALANRKWGVKGTIRHYHDSHGLCYDVRHDDGTEGCYEPTEFEVLPQPKGVASQGSK